MTTAADELVDVVDAGGVTIGVATRREMRARRLPHRCCYVLVFDREDRLLVHLRTATKDVYPSHWDVAVGGVVGAGESYDEGARRELAEEVGITDAEPQPLFDFRHEDATNLVNGRVYRVISDGPLRLQAEEVVRGEWLPPADVLERIRRDPFCPDGVVAFARYLSWLDGSNAG